MRYPGGKFRCYQKLINLIPPHRVYIETHLGGGAVLRNKAPAILTIGIDRDSEIIQMYADKFDSSYRFITGTAERFLEDYCFKGDEFVYADPPYWPASKRSSRSPYRYRYTEAEHINLLRLLSQVPCPVMISGYANATYDHVLSGWHKYVFMGTSHVGLREETVWLNFQPTILHDTRYLGTTFRERQSIKRKRARWIARFRNEPLVVQQALLNDFTDNFVQ
jgi:site-specific DNA-adenine methylase